MNPSLCVASSAIIIYIANGHQRDNRMSCAAEPYFGNVELGEPLLKGIALDQQIQ